MTARLRSVWRNLVHRGRAERDLDDEMKDTLARIVTEKTRAGLSPEAARREAQMVLNGLEPVKEQIRQSRAGAGCDAILQDFKYALRTLRRSPGFTISSILSLTLGVGAITLVFSVVNGVLLRRLPIPDPANLMFVARVIGADTATKRLLTYADYRVFQERNAAFEGLAAYTQFPVAFELRGEVRREMPVFAAGNYF